MKIDGKESKVFLQEIVFNEHEDINEVQLMRTGSFSHPFFDDFEITEDMFKSFKRNFDKHVKKVDLAVDFSHDSGGKAAGWITAVTLKENNTQLFITVSWTDSARRQIRDKEFRYMSADFFTNFEDNETGKKFGPTLNGAALTNRPFIKDMQAVLSDIDMSEEKRHAIREILDDKPIEKDIDQMATKEEIKEYIASLSDEDKAKQGLIETKEVEVQLSDDESKEALESQKAENIKLKEQIEKDKKEATFNALLADGDAVEAQKEAFMKDDVAAFAKLSVDTNMDGKGTGGEPDNKKTDADAPKTFDEAADKANELVIAMMKEDKTLKLSDANKRVLSDNPELEKIMEAA